MLVVAGVAGARAAYRSAPILAYPSAKGTLIGRFRTHRVQPGETLLDIARKYDLGITKLHPLTAQAAPSAAAAGATRLRFAPRRRGAGTLLRTRFGSSASGQLYRPNDGDLAAARSPVWRAGLRIPLRRLLARPISARRRRGFSSAPSRRRSREGSAGDRRGRARGESAPDTSARRG